jgi:hypothetical protein
MNAMDRRRGTESPAGNLQRETSLVFNGRLQEHASETDGTGISVPDGIDTTIGPNREPGPSLVGVKPDHWLDPAASPLLM